MPLAAELTHIPDDEIMTQASSHTVSIYEALAEILSKPTESLTLSDSKSTDRTLLSEAQVSSTVSTTTTTTTSTTTPQPTTAANDELKVENSTLHDHDKVRYVNTARVNNATPATSTENVLPLTSVFGALTLNPTPKTSKNIYNHELEPQPTTTQEFSTDSMTTFTDHTDLTLSLTNNITASGNMTNGTNESEIEMTKANLRFEDNQAILKSLKVNSPNEIIRNGLMKAFTSSTVPPNYSPRFSDSNRIPIFLFGSIKLERKFESMSMSEIIDLMTNRITKSGDEMLTTPSVFPIYRPELDTTTTASVFGTESVLNGNILDGSIRKFGMDLIEVSTESSQELLDSIDDFSKKSTKESFTEKHDLKNSANVSFTENSETSSFLNVNNSNENVLVKEASTENFSQKSSTESFLVRTSTQNIEIFNKNFTKQSSVETKLIDKIQVKSSTENFIGKSSTESFPDKNFLDKSSTKSFVDKISTESFVEKSSTESCIVKSSTESFLDKNFNDESSTKSFLDKISTESFVEKSSVESIPSNYSAIQNFHQNLIEKDSDENSYESLFKNKSETTTQSLPDVSISEANTISPLTEKTATSPFSNLIKYDEITISNNQELIDFGELSTISVNKNTTFTTRKPNPANNFEREHNDLTKQVKLELSTTSLDLTTLSKQMINDINELTTFPSSTKTSTSKTLPPDYTPIKNFLSPVKLPSAPLSSSVSFPSPFKLNSNLSKVPKSLLPQPFKSQKHSEPRERYAYAILPNNTVVRKVIQLHTTTEDALVIYGILSNNTIVKKFRNGTIVTEENKNRIEVVNIDPMSLINPNSEFHQQPTTEMTLAISTDYLPITEQTKTVFYMFIPYT